jgi:4-hydroxythreonine-4-phosphate dehydrogenase
MREVYLLVLTLGDPHSVNIEIFRRLLDEPSLVAAFSRLKKETLIVFCGSNWHWRDQERRCGFPPYRFDQILIEGGILPTSGMCFLDIPDLSTESAAETLTPMQRGQVATAALNASIKLQPPAGTYAVVTGPIDKHACNTAGFTFPGQTEFYSNAFGGNAVMLLAGDKLKVGLVTNHLALADVPKVLSQDLIVRKGQQLALTLRQVFGIASPRIAVCGLNPHAGDNGLFGWEEIDLIAPAVAELNQSAEMYGSGVQFSGPHPADTVFYRTVQGRFDAVLAMYHDQGLGPMKTLHFDDGINVSGGLKHLRVSPDHGPAKDLFLTNTANAASFLAAIKTALAYVEDLEHR